MSVELVGLALALGLVTYPSRALPLLVPGIERLPPRALLYLRLVGPAMLTALAAVNTLVETDGHPTLHVGIELPAVLLCALLVNRRGILLVGLIAAVLVVAIARATGIAPLPVS